MCWTARDSVVGVNWSKLGFDDLGTEEIRPTYTTVGPAQDLE